MIAKNDIGNPGEIIVFTGAQRPDLLARTSKDDCPLIDLWPEFFDGGASSQRYFPRLYELPQLARFQLIAVHTLGGKETIVGNGNSTPFFWTELANIGNDCESPRFGAVLRTLPDGGFDTILARGVNQAVVRKGKKITPGALTQDQVLDMPTWTLKNTPNALSALAIAVLPEWRRYNVAEMLIKEMKEIAKRESLAILVVPLRPTKKTLFQDVDMATYAEWRQEAASVPGHGETTVKKSEALREEINGHQLAVIEKVDEGINVEANRRLDGDIRETAKRRITEKTDKDSDGVSSDNDAVQGQPKLVPFDPWLRKHVRLGAKIVKVAPVSMTFRGNAAQWEKWTGIDVRQRAQEMVKLRESVWVQDDKEVPVSFQVKGCLAPMKYYPSRDIGEYVEPNLWLFHSVV
ncbi:uncharacterized protein GIQ15_03774 [Arthroderma uncinatum]|uniref:uncharacterized protein n=1 Tax=Arthroderma uncinatum TaxID=74035 RepID=UPI00144AD418|nr:uncharacterized protein GIQ15_03774 [Arthroderma uncinatum]KAF3484450.1 hypothetical protein GIQ15_03774 [Arthroderma uncinatum]